MPDSSKTRSNASASSLEDDELVEAAIKGDDKAFKQLADKYQRALHFHVAKMVKNQAHVEDLVQESLAKAFESLGKYNFDYAFSTWLYRITTNHTIDYLRKKKLQTVSINEPVNTGEGNMRRQIPDKKAGSDRRIIKKQRQNIVRNAIDELPDKYRSVIHLRHMQEKSYQEISEELALPLGTVKAHIFRARELLYKALKDRRGEF